MNQRDIYDLSDGIEYASKGDRVRVVRDDDNFIGKVGVVQADATGGFVRILFPDGSLRTKRLLDVELA